MSNETPFVFEDSSAGRQIWNAYRLELGDFTSASTFLGILRWPKAAKKFRNRNKWKNKALRNAKLFDKRLAQILL